jgi:cytochrome P450
LRRPSTRRRFSSAVSAHRQIPNGLGPPEHTAFRAANDPFFAPERMRALESQLRAHARDIVSTLPREAAVDTVVDFACGHVADARDDRRVRLHESALWLDGMMAKVVGRLGDHLPETLSPLQATLAELQGELLEPMAKEDAVLFRPSSLPKPARQGAARGSTSRSR